MLNEGRELVALIALVNLELAGAVALTDSSDAVYVPAVGPRPSTVVDGHSSYEDVVAAWAEEEQWWETRLRVVAVAPTSGPMSVSHPVEQALYEAIRAGLRDIWTIQDAPDLGSEVEQIAVRLLAMGLLELGASRRGGLWWHNPEQQTRTRLGLAVQGLARRDLARSRGKPTIGRSLALEGANALWAIDPPLAEVLWPDPEEQPQSSSAFGLTGFGCGSGYGSGC